ncbi:tRNA dihydrouridine synthase [Butyricicoccus porcorum]|uniref:tRNA-dihydrouridine synthase n=1 Tax=Butyricicoccus porcorum TaxID=1945634 RepID=A0A252F351_9FIRM|nr:tRNA-dihydrouridine synthase family protein [Butyricicoccus porcorum]OUM20238.1 diguanylate cyclase [Butyricicoccus porcorum]
MRYYFAPLEGITGYIFRNTYKEHFGAIDAYFSPFLGPNRDGGLRSGEINDILPQNNSRIHLVPQILTNDAAAFGTVADRLCEYGYEEVNLNLGCPSGTVVAKKKGAGLLAEMERLERFLDEIFSQCSIRISIKTRIGKDSPEEFPALLELFNRYPVSELIVHPRVQTDFYRNQPNWEAFACAVNGANMPVCYNGDLFTTEDIYRFAARFPTVETVMLGRGLLSNPGLAAQAEGHAPTDKKHLYGFHDALLERYQEVLSGQRNVLFKMKELWVYLSCLFEHPEKYAKKIRKAQTLAAYRKAVDELFAEQELRNESSFAG